MVGDHERGAVGTELLVDLFGEPALMSELEAVAPGREQRQGAAEPVVVPMEVRGELPDDRTQLAGLDERLDALVEAADPLREVLEAPDVRQVATRLGGDHEIGWCLLNPARHGVGRGEPVEGRVDLDGVEDLRVTLEPASLGQALRIEPAAPAVVLPT